MGQEKDAGLCTVLLSPGQLGSVAGHQNWLPHCAKPRLTEAGTVERPGGSVSVSWVAP